MMRKRVIILLMLMGFQAIAFAELPYIRFEFENVWSNNTWSCIVLEGMAASVSISFPLPASWTEIQGDVSAVDVNGQTINFSKTAPLGEYILRAEAWWEDVAGLSGCVANCLVSVISRSEVFIVSLHGNGAVTADGSGMMDMKGRRGEGRMFPERLFMKSENVPGDVSERLLGWWPGTGVYDGAEDRGAQLWQEGVWLQDKDIEEWIRQGWAEKIDEVLHVHFYAIWQSEVSVKVRDSDGGILLPEELQLVKYSVRPDPEWKTGDTTVSVFPGEQVLLVELDPAYADSYMVQVLKDGEELTPVSEGGWVYDIPSTDGPRNIDLEIRVGAKEEKGSIRFRCSGELTSAQNAAWGKYFPEFKKGQVQIKVWPEGVSGGNGITVEEFARLPVGTYRAEIAYKELEAGGQPYWGGPNREIIIKDGIEVAKGKTKDVPVEFLPFGTREANYYWIDFDGNGGTVTGHTLLWFGRWADTEEGASLNVRALPTDPKRAGGWKFAGWFTPGGKKIAKWKDLESFLRYEALQNLTLTANWKVVENAATGSGVVVPNAWLTTYAGEVLAANGGDYEAASVAMAANGMPIWECFVAGVDPSDADASFKAELVQEKEQLKARPKGGEQEGRVYSVWGKKEMDEEIWTIVTDVEDLDAEGWRFFRVGVGMAE